MTDYFCPPPPIKPRTRSSHSTAGDTNIPPQQWIWSLHSLTNTPSQKHGITWQTESHERSRAVYWMVQAAISLALPQIIIATAATYLHRFYMRKSMQKYPIKEISATAFFLATKVEEVPRKLEYVVKEYLKLDHKPTQQETSNGSEDPKEFERLKQHILYYEDILLRTLCFDLAIDHPYVPLIRAVKGFHVSWTEASMASSPTYPPSKLIDFSNSMKARSIAQSAWSFVNDSLMTTLCVTTDPSVVAAAAFLIAMSHRAIEGSSLESDLNNELSSIDQNDSSTQAGPLLGNIDRLIRPSASGLAQPHEPWWKAFGAQSLAEVHDAANTILEQYNDSVAPRVLKQVRKIPSLIESSGSLQPSYPTSGLDTEAKPDIDIDGKSDIGGTEFKSDFGGADPKSDIGTDFKPDTGTDYVTKPAGLVSDTTIQHSTTPVLDVSNTENIEPSTTPPASSPLRQNPIETPTEVEPTTHRDLPEESIRKRPRTLSQDVLSIPSPNKHIKTEHPITPNEDPVSREDTEVDGELASSDMQMDMKMSTPGSQDGEEMVLNHSVRNEVGMQVENAQSLDRGGSMEDGEVA